ncbi:fimbrial protein [Rahnella ecdela]|uniref:Fimbrial protein n=1 Tax=Rahnella ecdela TaxID=2816250 RepID=A0ABS6LA87_9GAMM|nr:fimbrial protein [Rahnella ecdela]MBU9843755.1 fimbrial protein [Rahnella ecdela]
MNYRQIKKLLLLGLLPLLFTGYAGAYTYTCTGKNGSPKSINVNFGDVTINDPEKNVAGQMLDNADSWNVGGRIPVKCDEPSGPRYRRFTASSPLPASENDGTRQWYRITDYLDTAINIAVQGNRYVPFKNVRGGGANDAAGNTSMPAGATGYLDLKIMKPFIGTTSFSNVIVAEIFLSKQSGTYSPEPIARITLSGKVVVPQNCTINAGTVMSVNLGTLYSSDFKTAGEMPAGYTPRTLTFPVKCSGVEAYANLTLRLQGTTSAGVINALQSDNQDIGVVITDETGNPVIPNDQSSAISFDLDENFESNVTLHAYPVGTSGNIPAEGPFTTLAYLRIDFA